MPNIFQVHIFIHTERHRLVPKLQRWSHRSGHSYLMV